MRVGALRERHPGEARVAMTPASAQDIRKLGHECHIEAGAGHGWRDLSAAWARLAPEYTPREIRWPRL